VFDGNHPTVIGQKLLSAAIQMESPHWPPDGWSECEQKANHKSNRRKSNWHSPTTDDGDFLRAIPKKKEKMLQAHLHSTTITVNHNEDGGFLRAMPRRRNKNATSTLTFNQD
jgi:hypothetical protein